MNRFNVFYLVFVSLFNTVTFAAQLEEQKEELIELLKDRSFIYNPSTARRSYKYKDKIFSIDPRTGDFYMQDSSGQRKKLDFEWKSWHGTISDNGIVLYQLDQNTMSPADRIAFNALAVFQRSKGIFTIKSINPQCYLAYADERLDSDPVERISALERRINPRPLIFKNDNEWLEFRKDIKDLFKNFSGPNSYVVIIGSSTTFFSENPAKGRSLSLFIGAPECLKDAVDNEKTLNVATFDMPNAEEKSDVDINILIPKLSLLCEQSVRDSRRIGNDGTRGVYNENLLDQCFEASKNPEIQALARGGTQSDMWPLKGKAFQEFLDKWTTKLGGREINFSVRILPNQLKPPIKRPGAQDNFNKEIRYQKFAIPVN